LKFVLLVSALLPHFPYAVASGTSEHAMAVVKVFWGGYYPVALTYDPRNGDLYVYDGYVDAVRVLNPYNGSVMRTIVTEVPVATFGNLEDSAIAYDPRNGYIYVGTLGGVYAVDTEGDSVVQILRLNVSFYEMVYDPENGYVYMVGYIAKYRNGYIYSSGPVSIYVLDPSNGSIVDNIKLSSYDVAVACDPLNGFVYVQVAKFLYAIDPRNNSIVET